MCARWLLPSSRRGMSFSLFIFVLKDCIRTKLVQDWDTLLLFRTENALCVWIVFLCLLIVLIFWVQCYRPSPLSSYVYELSYADCKFASNALMCSPVSTNSISLNGSGISVSLSPPAVCSCKYFQCLSCCYSHSITLLLNLTRLVLHNIIAVAPPISP